jgi:hypothetical protein
MKPETDKEEIGVMKKRSRITRLLGCPFCGEIPKLMRWHGGTKYKRAVSCENENCAAMPTVIGANEAKAVDKWNNRSNWYSSP